MMPTTIASSSTRLSTRIADRTARFVLFALRARAFFILFLLLLLFTVLTPDFMTWNNLTILAKHVSISALLAVGMTFVVLAGGIDLSVGSIAGFGGIIAGLLIKHGIDIGGTVHYPPIPLVIFITTLACMIIGTLNGFLIAKASVPPFIATLGTLYIARGTALLLSNGHTIPNLEGIPARHNTGFTAIGQGFFLGVPLPVWIMLIVAVFAGVVATTTPFGRHVYAVGGNERAARLTGIRVERIKLITYVLSSICAALVGLIIASQLESAHPATGESFELNAIAAVVLGGTSLMGGRGSVTGSIIGACVIGVLADGLIMLGVSEFWQIVIKGVVIVVAVAIDQIQVRLQAYLLPLLARSTNQGVS